MKPWRRTTVRHLEVLHEIEVLNARIDDLVGLITSQMPDGTFPCNDEPYCETCDKGGHVCPGCGADAPHSMTDPGMSEVAHIPGCPLHVRTTDEQVAAVRLMVSPDVCAGCGLVLPPGVPFNRCGYCNL